ncbi:M23 family metallopeptidase [Leifsonia sp. H3M29-4]|uniref:M23 family metallopeptidase n=1 Tax=Salinibacterium metalliresistens TaxID=3031321 RepID=UPI0023DCBBA6|nr:M23 family metallopeptidase [Salinibacterium metalliresistens]MDF1480390.1 M23 family metallopeptidase [Salinibacterium metalliresistens]
MSYSDFHSGANPRRRDLHRPRATRRQPRLGIRVVRRILTFDLKIVAAAVCAALLVVPLGLPAYALSTVDQSAPTTRPDGPPQTLMVAADVPDTAVNRDTYLVMRTVPGGLRPYSTTADTFANDPTSSIQWPFVVGVPISSWFGYRTDPWPGFHSGLDMNPGVGTPVQAIADGVVSEASDGGNSYGVYVVIDHVIDGQKVSSLYAHMLSGSRTLNVGDRVTVAQTVGLVGSTGLSTGAHLHFEVRLNGTDAIDPYAWLKEKVGS